METLKARIISSGSEILQGLYPDTNAQSLSQKLTELGYRVIGHQAIPDDKQLLNHGLDFATKTADLVVLTGGLGPTLDDLTRDAVCELYQIPLKRNQIAVRLMQRRFKLRGYEMPDRNLVQADIPEGAVVLQNHWGTAPGFYLPAPRGSDRGALIALPGPPHEWTPMFNRLFDGRNRVLLPSRRVTKSHTIHLAMVPESLINERLQPLFDEGHGSSLTILASRGHIRIRLLVESDIESEITKAFEELYSRVKRALDGLPIFMEGSGDLTFPEVILNKCRERSLTLTTAESCTGGGIAFGLTSVAGSSDIVLGGWVTYSNEAKSRDLGVKVSTLESFGAVSSEVAAEMAEGARKQSGSSLALSVTGIAGPGGGSKEKPVGTVWFGLSSEHTVITIRKNFPGDRETVREFAIKQGYELLRGFLEGDLMELQVKKPDVLKN